MKSVFVVASVAIFPAFAASSEEDIRSVLQRQVADWNNGRIEAFMVGYDENVVFVSSSVTRGRKPVLEGYLKRYPTREKMGALTFSNLEIRLLGSDHASVLGQWDLRRSVDAGGDTGGWFTLLLRRGVDGWRIIHDHTSARSH
jgi:uncharacterized protein (TIGR02246 family)